eukprot:586160-Rhodomonas_salina.1
MPACGEVESCESWKSDGVNSSGRRSSPILVSARQVVPRNQTTDPSHLHRAVMQEDCQDTSSPIPPCYCKAVAQSCSTTDRQSSCNVVTAAEDSQSSPVLVSSCHGVRHNKKTDSVDRTVMQEDSHRSSSPISTCQLVPQNGAAGAESYTKSSPTQAKRLDNSAIQEDGPGQCTGPSCSPGVRRGEELSIGHWQLKCLQWCTWSEGEGFCYRFTQLHTPTKQGNPCLPCSSGHSNPREQPDAAAERLSISGS